MTITISPPTSSETLQPTRTFNQTRLSSAFSAPASVTYTYAYSTRPTFSAISKATLFEYLAGSVFEIASRVNQSEAKIGSTVQTVLALANFLLEDGSATPQATPDGQDGIDVEWLVNGNSLVINCVSDSEVHVWAEDASGVEVVAIETNSRWATTDDGLVRAKEFLTEISGQVVNRIHTAR